MVKQNANMQLLSKKGGCDVAKKRVNAGVFGGGCEENTKDTVVLAATCKK